MSEWVSLHGVVQISFSLLIILLSSLKNTGTFICLLVCMFICLFIHCGFIQTKNIINVTSSPASELNSTFQNSAQRSWTQLRFPSTSWATNHVTWWSHMFKFTSNDTHLFTITLSIRTLSFLSPPFHTLTLPTRSSSRVLIRFVYGSAFRLCFGFDSLLFVFYLTSWLPWQLNSNWGVFFFKWMKWFSIFQETCPRVCVNIF